MDGRQEGKRQGLTGPELLAGSHHYPSLEIPEIEVDGKPSIVYFRALSTRDVMAFGKKLAKAGIKPGASAADLAAASSDDENVVEIMGLIAKCVCDADGKRLFGSKEDVEALQDLDMRIFTRLSNAVTNLINGKPLDAPQEVGPAGNPTAEATSISSASTSASPTA